MWIAKLIDGPWPNKVFISDKKRRILFKGLYYVVVETIGMQYATYKLDDNQDADSSITRQPDAGSKSRE